MQYKRNDFDFSRATFRVRGDVIEVFPAYEEDLAIRIEMFGDDIEKITEIDPLTGRTRQVLKRLPSTLAPTTLLLKRFASMRLRRFGQNCMREWLFSKKKIF